MRSHPNVTEVVARYIAGSVDVCKSGGYASLHFGTPQGVVVVRVDLREFVLKCRGERDHNLVRLPTVADYAPAAAESRLAKMESPESPGIRGTQPWLGATYGAAWEFLKANLEMTIRDAAVLHDVSPYGFQSWVSSVHTGELRALRQAAGLSIRPLGREALARRGEIDRPLVRKPGGKIL